MSFTIINILTVHYHKKRPTSQNMNRVVIEDPKVYSIDKVARALDSTKAAISVYSSPSQGILLYKHEGRISGYEILRYSKRPKAGRGFRTYKDIAEIFFISQGDVELLVKAKVLKQKGQEHLVPRDDIQKLYDLVFPKQATKRYDEVMGILRRKRYVARTSSPAKVARSARRSYEPEKVPRIIVAGEGSSIADVVNEKIPEEVGTSDAVQEKYIPITEIRKSLRKGVDFDLVPHANVPNRDAFYIRHKKSIASDVKDNGILVNANDVDRLYLAKAYLPGDELLRLYTRFYGGQLSEEIMIHALNLAGIPAIRYNQGHRYPQGTLDIVMLNEEDIRRIARVAKPLIDENGYFFSLEVGKKIIRRDAQLEYQRDGEERKIKFIKEGSIIKINAFQFAEAYFGILSSRK